MLEGAHCPRVNLSWGRCSVGQQVLGAIVQGMAVKNISDGQITNQITNHILKSQIF